MVLAIPQEIKYFGKDPSNPREVKLGDASEFDVAYARVELVSGVIGLMHILASTPRNISRQIRTILTEGHPGAQIIIVPDFETGQKSKAFSRT